MSFFSNPFHSIQSFVHNPVAALNIPHGPNTWITPLAKTATNAGIGFLTGGPAGAVASAVANLPGETNTHPYTPQQAVSSLIAGHYGGGSDMGQTFNQTLQGGGSLTDAATAAGNIGASQLASVPSALAKIPSDLWNRATTAMSGLNPTAGNFGQGAGAIGKSLVPTTASHSIFPSLIGALSGGALTHSALPMPSLTPITAQQLDAASLPLMQKQMQDRIASLEGQLAGGGGLSSGQLYELNNLREQLAMGLSAQGASNAIQATNSSNQVQQKQFGNKQTQLRNILTGAGLGANIMGGTNPWNVMYNNSGLLTNVFGG